MRCIEKEDNINYLYLKADLFSGKEKNLEFSCLIGKHQTILCRKPVQNYMKIRAH